MIYRQCTRVFLARLVWRIVLDSRLIKLFPMLLLASTLNSQAAWLPLSDISLMVEPGSILDFSEITRTQREQTISQIKSGEQTGVQSNSKYLMANLGFGAAQGGYPTHAVADMYVRELIMHGYNAVRLDFVEAILMEGRQADFDFDPEQVDRLYYLLYLLDKEGIKYILNGLSSDNAGYGNIKQRWKANKRVTVGLYYSAEAQAHWKELMKRLFLPLNPYTGRALINSPGLMGIIMVNESSIPFLTRNGVPQEFKPQLEAWLLKKYGSTQAIPSAWKLEGKIFIDFPKVNDRPSTKMTDVQEFYLELEQKTASWMQDFFREVGYKGSLTIYNNWNSPGEHLARAGLDWVDMHNYFAHPAYLGDGKMVVPQKSMLATHAGYIRELAVTRYTGKPYTVSEYGQVFWNSYRRESALAIPAYSAFQGWNAICQHSGPIHLSYASKNPKWDSISPFGIGVDPIGRLTETLGALLYLRGDVRRAGHDVNVQINTDILNKSSQLDGIPGDIGRLSLVVGVGLSQGQYSGENANVEVGKAGIFYNGKIYKNSNFLSSSIRAVADTSGHVGQQAAKSDFSKNQLWSGRFDELIQSGLLSANNRTDPGEGVYQTDTGEIVLSAKKRHLQLITAKTEAIVFDQLDSIKLDNLKMISADGPALLAVSALDDKPLLQSQRMLVILGTDARNSGMKFADAEETMLQDIGKQPVLLRTVSVQIHLRNTNNKNLKVYATNLRGQRVSELPVKVTTDGVEVVLDTHILPNGPTPFFEIVKQ